jgi:hypothetical protein
VCQIHDVQLPKEDKAYIPQIVLLEPAFDAICQKYGLPPADSPYAAALAAFKLVAGRFVREALPLT